MEMKGALTTTDETTMEKYLATVKWAVDEVLSEKGDLPEKGGNGDGKRIDDWK